MKIRHFSLAIMSLTLFFAVYCHKSETNEAKVEASLLYFVLADGTHSTSASMAFDAAGGTQSLTLHSTGAWSASCDADWINLPISGTAGDATYVDLGPSVLWATWNLGATAPEELGGQYTWGDTYPYDHEYGSGGSYNLYDPLGDGANGYDDIVHLTLGGNWRMPTREESMELRENTTLTYTTVNGVEGALLTSTVEGYEDRSIFLPSTSEYIEHTQECGYYWTSTQSERYSNYAHTIVFNYTSIFASGGATCISQKFSLMHIRPVCDN